MKLREEIYNHNMAVIQKYRTDLYKALMKEDLEKAKSEVVFEEAKDGNKIVCFRQDGKNYYLNSKYAPVREANVWAEKYEIKNVNQITIVFGFGNGMFIQALLDKISKNNIIIVYEPSAQLFREVLENIELEELLNNRQLFIVVESINEQKFKEIIEGVVDVSNFGNQNCLVLPRYTEIFAETYDKFIKKIKAIEENIYVAQLTKMYLSKQAMNNSIKNVRYIMESKSLSNARETLPSNMNAILVSAGPSLMSEIENLKKAKGKALIVAVDRILDLLLDHGIVPDILASVDPVKETPKSKKLEEVDMTLLTLPTCNPELYRKHKGNKLVCNNGSLYHSICVALKENESIVPTGGSVATFAFGALIGMGIKRIILVGQDLAFQNGKSHAGNSQEEDPWNLKIEAEGVDGELVTTRQDWRMFADDFEGMIADHPDIECIDTKKTGLKIKGTKLMGMKEVLEKYCQKEVPVQKWLGDIKAVFPEKNRKKVLDLFQDYIDELDKIKEISKEGMKLCDKLQKETQEGTFSGSENLMEKLQQLTKELEQQQVMVIIADILYGCTNEMQAKIADLESGDNLWTDTKVVFQKTIDVSKEMKKELDSAMKELKEYFGEK